MRTPPGFIGVSEGDAIMDRLQHCIEVRQEIGRE